MPGTQRIFSEREDTQVNGFVPSEREGAGELLRGIATGDGFSRLTPRSVHDDKRVQELLSVPRYADILDIDDDSEEDETAQGSRPSRVAPHGLVVSSAAWRAELAKWKEDRDDDAPLEYSNPRNKGMFPRSLALLFGGTAKRPATVRSQRKPAHSEEILMMELLAAEYEGEQPDDGALEGSDDDYEE